MSYPKVSIYRNIDISGDHGWISYRNKLWYIEISNFRYIWRSTSVDIMSKKNHLSNFSMSYRKRFDISKYRISVFSMYHIWSSSALHPLASRCSFSADAERSFSTYRLSKSYWYYFFSSVSFDTHHTGSWAIYSDHVTCVRIGSRGFSRGRGCVGAGWLIDLF